MRIFEAIVRRYLDTTTLISTCTLLLQISLQLQSHSVNAWMPDVRPDLQPKQDKIIAKFLGNSTDYFKILDYDEASILVGAKDVIYNISLNGLRENSRLEWHSSDADRELCALKGKGEADCHNYIRVFARLDNDQILVCGTNSHKPRCRHYAPTSNELSAASGSGQRYEIARDVEAQGLCPYSPAHNSTYAFADGQLYSATVADFSGSDPLIYRENLRTEQYDLKQLNQPDFVGAVERNGYVMFFFREISMEYMNFGKTIYSRVGRVCKNDRGGPYTLSKSWTSFLKARLNCSVPGEFPFYFDEIQAITPITESGVNALIYAVFTTSVNAIPGSAVCAFNLEDIMDAFEGNFKSQKDSQSQWLPVQDEQIPDPRPGQCVEDSRMLSSIAVNFVKNHPLMEMAVPAVYGRPLLTKVNLHHRLTTIAIDAQILALNGEYYDVIYTGTDDGKITKFINIPTPSIAGSSGPVDKLKTVVISEMQVLPVGVPVRELVVSAKTNTLLVVSDGSLLTVPLHHCAHIVDCFGCLSLQDPNCAWDQQNHECKSLATNNNKFGTKTYLQSLNSTKKVAAALCPKFTRGTLMGDGPGNGGAGVPNVAIDTLSSQLPQADDEQALEKKLHYSKVGATLNGANGGDNNSGNDVNIASSSDMDALTGDGEDFALNSFSDETKITLHSVDPDQLMTPFNDPLHSTASVNGKTIQLAGKSFYWNFAPLFVAVAFIIGIVVGLYGSKRICKATLPHANHRNQFNSNSQFGVKHHNSGKDINLLMNPNHFCSQKKPNLDLEKDRSHECKNSTENLEKELPCKTSTLTKVKLGSPCKLSVTCPEADEAAHPHCPHGPTLLIYQPSDGDGKAQEYFACAAHRDKRLCNFHLPVRKLTAGKLQRRYDVTEYINEYRKGRRKLLDVKEGDQCHYCLECNVPLLSADLPSHISHEVVRNLTEAMLQDPTTFLPPLDDDKVQAQYFFDRRALQFFGKCFEDLKICKVVCMGAPRLHAYLRNECPSVQSFLLDFDHRFFYFEDKHFAWYNMCNNHFFDNQQKLEFKRFLKHKKSQCLLIFTDPPFGCRTEPIASTLRQLTALHNAVNQLLYQPVPVFWIFPYFSEHYIQQTMPEMKMCDYRVNYTNHAAYTDIGNKSRKLGSPVRIFTNVPLELLRLPVQEEYKYCTECQRYTALQNQHCDRCGCCPSKNGSTYRHCDRCGVCVKPTYVHCANCRRCTQAEAHSCQEYQTKQRCWICLDLGHIERNCPSWRAHCNRIILPASENRSDVITCLLCGRLGHNERHCAQRKKYIEESLFLGETKVKFKLFPLT